MDWRKSTYSGANGGQCVEVSSGDGVMVRDTTDRDGQALTFSAGAWAAFVTRLRSLVGAGNLGLPGYRTADALDDPVRFHLCDFIELVVEVATFEGVEKRSLGPFKVVPKLLVVLCVPVFDSPEDSARFVAAAVVVDDRVVGDLRRHGVLL